jgi:hypothetical protein
VNRLSRRENELFIGKDKLNLEGRTIKHPGLIANYGNLNVNKISKTPIKLIGLDLETNHLTAELKLLGFWNGEKYCNYTQDFIQIMFAFVRSCDRKGKCIAYWNRLDPCVLFKQFLLELDDQQTIENAMKRFGKVAGKWMRKTGTWITKPVVEIMVNDFHFGIKNAIRSSIQFFYYRDGDTYLHEVWAYDIAALYENGLEMEALGKKDEATGTYPNARLPYYEKGGDDLHKIDWIRFDKDPDFRNRVLKSNYLDARAAYDLGCIIQEEFHKAFAWYPNTLISQGSLARAAIVASTYEKYKTTITDPDDLQDKIYKEILSIPFRSHYDKWANAYGSDFLRDFYCMVCESYSGGYIESVRYGFTPEAFTADLTSAYPSVIVNLFDLRDCVIQSGSGTPPHFPNSYCFIRGEVDIPINVNFHPVTVKHPLHNETNIRAVGNYIASYTIEERDFLLALGTTFKNETWYNVQTTGKPSPIAESCQMFYNLRMKLRAEKNSAQYMAKIAMNSLYGILYEAVDTYDDIENDVERAGYRAGEFFNPIYASIITSRVRIQLAKAANDIEKKGGKPILLMTDSIYWTGKADMLDPATWKEEKTLGYYEKPERVKNMVCLGSGRYEYETEKGKHTAKKRGLNAVDIHSPDGVIINDFNWKQALSIMRETGKDKIIVNVRTLLTVGLITHNNTYTFRDLGLIKDEIREVEAVVGRTKRNYDLSELKDPSILSTSMIDTEPLYLGFGMLGKPGICDQSLPELRNEVFKHEVKTTYQKRKETWRSGSKTHYAKKKNTIADDRKLMTKKLLALGYTSDEAHTMKDWSVERINMQLRKDGME